MKTETALALVLFVGIGTPAFAEPQRPGQASDVAPAAPGALSSSEIIVMVRSIGFDPVTRPVARGATYVLRAIDPNDVDVHLVVDARTGRILSVNPTVVAPPRYGGGFAPPGIYPRAPGYRPGPTYSRDPVVRPPGEISPFGGDFDEPPPRPSSPPGYRGGASLPQTLNPGMDAPANRTAAVSPPTPLPRPRPNGIVTGSINQVAKPPAAQNPTERPASQDANSTISIVPVAPLE